MYAEGQQQYHASPPFSVQTAQPGPTIMQAHAIGLHPNQQPVHRVEFNTTPCILALCMGSQMLVLDTDQASVVTSTCCCCNNTARINYGDVGTVDVSQACCLYSLVLPQVGVISPGCGCDSTTIYKIQQELQARIKGRGAAGVADRLIHIEAKLDAIMNKLGI